MQLEANAGEWGDWIIDLRACSLQLNRFRDKDLTTVGKTQRKTSVQKLHQGIP